eukprot:gene4559-5793_t
MPCFAEGVGFITSGEVYDRAKVWGKTDILGVRHVLAVTDNKRLYSWGCGKYGRLGHGDYRNRYVPTLVDFFEMFCVEQCSAGHAHSAVITTPRVNSLSTATGRRAVTFGRGAHGRLGNGHVGNRYLPVAVSNWFESVHNYYLRQVVCGGAHTLALFSKSVEKTLANSLGVETLVSAWGYGGNGQLGHGYTDMALAPVKVKVPKWEIVVEISAGKTWSMARTVAGDLYTWGKGVRGELGQGARIYSLGPRKVNTFAAFVRLSSGASHNVCISTSKKHLNMKLVERGARSREDVFKDFVDMNPLPIREGYAQLFTCCRRGPDGGRGDLRRYICRTCKMESVCHLCSRMCHSKHDVVSTTSGEGVKRSLPRYCDCGVTLRCRVAPTIPETDESEDGEGERGSLSREARALQVLQTYFRAYVRGVEAEKREFMRRQVRQEVCEAYWEQEILAAVWTNLENSVGAYCEPMEQAHMAVEENRKKAFDSYVSLQQSLKAMDCMMEGVRLLLGRAGVMVDLGVLANTATAFGQGPGRAGSFALVGQSLTYSFAFTWHSLRNQQLKLNPNQRLSPALMATFAREYPRYLLHEGTYCDPDVALFTNRYMRDWRSVRRRERGARQKAKRFALEEKKRLASAPVFTGSLARLAVRKASQMVIVASKADALLQEIHEDFDYARFISKKSIPDTATLERVESRAPCTITRRQSVCDPERLYARVCKLRPTLKLKNYLARSMSLPTKLKSFHPPERMPWSYIASIRDSLDVFYNRNQIMYDFLDQENDYLWLRVSVAAKRRRLGFCLGYSWLTPKLPREFLQRKLDSGRRHTIGEPERYAKLIEVMFDTRRAFVNLRKL